MSFGDCDNGICSDCGGLGLIRVEGAKLVPKRGSVVFAMEKGAIRGLTA